MGCGNSRGNELVVPAAARTPEHMVAVPPAATAPSTNIAPKRLRRLEDEQREFREFLERLRMAKDKAEFDQFMAERRDRPADNAAAPQS